MEEINNYNPLPGSTQEERQNIHISSYERAFTKGKLFRGFRFILKDGTTSEVFELNQKIQQLLEEE